MISSAWPILKNEGRWEEEVEREGVGGWKSKQTSVRLT